MTQRRTRTRSDSVTTAVSAAIDAAKGPLQCPEYVALRPEDLPFWSAIIASRAREEWTDGDLIVAGQLARVHREVELETAALQLEGTVLTNERGTPVMNPRHSVLEALARRGMAYMRTLRMGGAAAGEARHVIQRRQASKRATAVQKELEGEQYLA